MTTYEWGILVMYALGGVTGLIGGWLAWGRS